MRILYLTNIPSPYIVDFLNEFGKYCNLTAIFEKSLSTTRDDSWKQFKFNNFKGIILRGINFDTDKAICPQVINYINKRDYDHIIVANPCTPTGIISIEYMKLMRIPFILQSEGGFAGTGKGLKERFKKHLMSDAKLYFSANNVGDEYFLTYGAKKDRIVRYPFTSLHKRDLLSVTLSEEEKADIKQQIGVNEELMILSVGRFISIKGYDILMKACAGIDQSIGIYIVGGDPTQEYKDLQTSLELNNIHYIGFKSKDELKKFYKAADLFVLQSRGDCWGLVINEAMACGLPIVTSDRCIAGNQLVKNGENGFIVLVEDYILLRKRIQEILDNNEMRAKMGAKSLEKIRWYTFENMAKAHIDVLKTIRNGNE